MSTRRERREAMTFRVLPDTAERLREHSARTGISQSRIVDDALREHLTGEDDDPAALVALIHSLTARLAARMQRG